MIKVSKKSYDIRYSCHGPWGITRDTRKSTTKITYYGNEVAEVISDDLRFLLELLPEWIESERKVAGAQT